MNNTPLGTSSSTQPDATPATLGLALGGGAVKGLAHIGLLKLLDKHRIRPTHISGTSMGAIIAALYAHGVSGEQIEQRVRAHIIQPGEKFGEILGKRDKLLKWTKVFSYERSKGGMVAADGLFKHLFEELIDLDFADLRIPTTICTTDFHLGKELALKSGSVLEAVRASMAVPGIFAPVTYQQGDTSRLLVDGGLVNNLPTNHIQHCDFKIASDVISLPAEQQPKTLNVLSGAINIMIVHNTQISLENSPADIVHHMDIEGIEAFDFHKIDDVLKIGDAAAKKLEHHLLASIV